jgi:hypothetical protein
MWNSYGCSDSTVLTIVVGASTSISTIGNEKHDLYFSAGHIFVIRAKQSHIKLIDLNGRVVLEKNLDETKTSIQIADNFKGIYIAEISDARSTFRKKLLLY